MERKEVARSSLTQGGFERFGRTVVEASLHEWWECSEILFSSVSGRESSAGARRGRRGGLATQ